MTGAQSKRIPAALLSVLILALSPGLPFYQLWADELVETGAAIAPAGIAGVSAYPLSRAPSAMTVSAQAGSFQQGVHVHLGANGAALPAGAALGSEASGLTSQGAAAPSAAALDSESAPSRTDALDRASRSPAAALIHTQRQVQAAMPDLSAVASMPAADAYDAGEKAMEPILRQYSAGGSLNAVSDDGVRGRLGSDGLASASSRFEATGQPGRTPAAAAAFAAPPAPAANGILPSANGDVETAKPGSSRFGEIARSLGGVAAGAFFVVGAQALAVHLAPAVFGGVSPLAMVWTLLSAAGVTAYYRPWKMRARLAKSRTQGLGAAKLLADVAMGAVAGSAFVSAVLLWAALSSLVDPSASISVGPLLGLMFMGALGAENALLPLLTGNRRASDERPALLPRLLGTALCIPFAFASGSTIGTVAILLYAAALFSAGFNYLLTLIAYLGKRAADAPVPDQNGSKAPRRHWLKTAAVMGVIAFLAAAGLVSHRISPEKGASTHDQPSLAQEESGDSGGWDVAGWVRDNFHRVARGEARGENGRRAAARGRDDSRERHENRHAGTDAAYRGGEHGGEGARGGGHSGSNPGGGHSNGNPGAPRPPAQQPPRQPVGGHSGGNPGGGHAEPHPAPSAGKSAKKNGR